MRSIVYSLAQAFRRVLVLLMLVCSLSLLAGFSPLAQSSYADHRATVRQPQDPQVIEQREEAYEEAKEIADDVKMGVEKEYEKEVKVYRKEHAGEGGIIEEAKELVTKTTGS